MQHRSCGRLGLSRRCSRRCGDAGFAAAGRATTSSVARRRASPRTSQVERRLDRRLRGIHRPAPARRSAGHIRRSGKIVDRRRRAPGSASARSARRSSISGSTLEPGRSLVRRGATACDSSARSARAGRGDEDVGHGSARSVTAPRVMGIVNVTPDSFSDGGSSSTPSAAIAHGRELAAEGADILDVGGESTRPGAEAVARRRGARAGRARWSRRSPGRRAGVPVSIDTSKAAVAEAALDAGAAIVNDVTALRADPELAGALRRARLRAWCSCTCRARRGRCRTTRATTTSSTTSGPSSPSGSRPRSRPGSPRSGSGSIPGSASARPSSTTSSCCGGLGELRELGRPIVDRHLAQELHRHDHRPRGRRAPRRHDRLERARARRAARTCSASTTCAERARRSTVAEAILGRRDVAARRLAFGCAWRRTATDHESVGRGRARGLSIYTHHGVSDAEQEVGQRLVLDISFDVPDCDAVLTDRLEDTSTTPRSPTSSRSRRPSAATGRSSASAT